MTHHHTKAHPDVLARLHEGSIEGALTIAQDLQLDFFELQVTYRAIFASVRELHMRSVERKKLSTTAFTQLLNIGSLELAGEALMLMHDGTLKDQFSTVLREKLAGEMVSQTCCISEGLP